MRRKCAKNPPIFILKIGNCCEIRLFLDLLYKIVKKENLVRKSPRRFNTLKSNEVARSERNRRKIGTARPLLFPRVKLGENETITMTYR